MVKTYDGSATQCRKILRELQCQQSMQSKSMGNSVTIMAKSYWNHVTERNALVELNLRPGMRPGYPRSRGESNRSGAGFTKPLRLTKARLSEFS